MIQPPPRVAKARLNQDQRRINNSSNARAACSYPRTRPTFGRLNSLLDQYLAKIQQASSVSAAVPSGKENLGPKKSKKSGQEGEDDDEVEKFSLGQGSTAKKPKNEAPPGPVKEAQHHAMQQSSNFSSGFASIAASFKPDTPEQFEAKAKAAATLVGSMSFG
jgi:hypothetical protein